jgi:type I restriction enzyme S subunit
MKTGALRDVLVPRNAIVHPRDDPSGEGTFVGLEHIEPHTGRRIGSLPIRLEKLTGRKARFYGGDIVYGYLRPYLNKVWVADFDGYCSVDQYVFRPTEAVVAGFIAAFMRSPLFLESAPIDESPGQLPRIRLDEVLDVRVPLPPIEVQRRVADDLSEQLAAIDRMSRDIEAQREAIGALPGALLRRAFEAIDTA